MAEQSYRVLAESYIGDAIRKEGEIVVLDLEAMQMEMGPNLELVDGDSDAGGRKARAK